MTNKAVKWVGQLGRPRLEKLPINYEKNDCIFSQKINLGKSTVLYLCKPSFLNLAEYDSRLPPKSYVKALARSWKTGIATLDIF